MALGFNVLQSSQARALGCESAFISDPSEILKVDYYVTATECFKNTNPGSGVLGNATIDDNFARVVFPAGFTVLSSTTTGSGCAESFSTTSGNIAAYKYGPSATCSVSILLTNGASLSFVATNAPDSLANSFTEVNFVAPGLPAWTLKADPSPTSFSMVGEDITYTYTVKNTGNVPINSINISGKKIGTNSCPTTLAVGASFTCTSVYKTQAGDLGNPILYEVVLKGDPEGGSLASQTTGGSIAFIAQPKFKVSATPTPGSFSKAGDNIAFAYTLENNGNIDIDTFSLTGTNTGSITCPAGPLAPGKSVTCNSTYTTSVSDFNAAGPIAYSVTAKGTVKAGTLSDATDSGSITFDAQPKFTVAATPTPKSFSKAGDNIAFAYMLENKGNVAIDTFSLTGTNTGAITCPAGPLAPGKSVTCNSTYTTTVTDFDAAGPIAYSVTAKGTVKAGALSDATDSGSITFDAQPKFTVAATPTPTSFSQAGDNIAFAYTLENKGNIAIDTFSLTGTNTGSITCPAGPLAPGKGVTCNSTYTTTVTDFNAAAAIAYSVTAKGTVKAGTLNDATDSGSITFDAQPKFTVAATPTPNSFSKAGDNIAFAYTLENKGNVAIDTFSLSGTNTGAITCPAGPLAPGKSVTCNSTYTTSVSDFNAAGPIAYSVTAKGTVKAGALSDATDSGSITFDAQPKFTLAATPTPTSFSKAGDNIAFAYTLANTGNVTIDTYTVSGTNTGAISCPAGPLAPGGSVACTSTYTTKTSDVSAAAPIPYAVTATGKVKVGSLADATASGNITFTALPALTVASVPTPKTFSKVGEVITYTYTVTNSGNVTLDSIAVSDTKASGISCSSTTLLMGAATTCSGTYSVTGGDILAGSISSTATAQGKFGATAVASAPVATTLQLDANAIRQATQEAIRGFMHRRAEIITSSAPDQGRKHQRLTGVLFGGGAGDDDDGSDQSSTGGGRTARGPQVDEGAERGRARSVASLGTNRDGLQGRTAMPFSFTGAAEDGTGSFAFATSLSQMLQSAQSERTAREASAEKPPMALGGPGRPSPASRNSTSRFDIWAEGMMSYYSDTALGPKQQGHAALLYVGADYRIHPAILVGALVQFDWISETASALSSSASGQGWMFGPYASIRLTRNLFFDVRAAWGRSDNRIDPFGLYTDSFETERGLVAGKLTGNWSFGSWKLRPSAEVVYFHEVQQAYTNQLSILIPEQSISLGRLIVGPEVGYQFKGRDGTTFEPYVGIKGVWDFARTGDASAAGLLAGEDPFHAKLEVGALYNDPSGASLRGSFAYDGIGDSSFQAYTGRMAVTIPFN